MIHCGDFWDYDLKWFQSKDNAHVVSEAGFDVLFVYFEELVDNPLELRIISVLMLIVRML